MKLKFKTKADLTEYLDFLDVIILEKKRNVYIVKGKKPTLRYLCRFFKIEFKDFKYEELPESKIKLYESY